MRANRKRHTNGREERTFNSEGNLNKSALKCEQVVAHSESLPFCAQAPKTSRRAAANLILGTSKDLIDCFGLPRKRVLLLRLAHKKIPSGKSTRHLVRETGRREKTVDNCFREVETAQRKELKERLSLDAQRLFDGGGEPSIPAPSTDSLEAISGW